MMRSTPAPPPTARLAVLASALLFAACIVCLAVGVMGVRSSGPQVTRLNCQLRDASEFKRRPGGEIRPGDCVKVPPDPESHPWVWFAAAFVCGAGGATTLIVSRRRAGGRRSN
jgi:hypothetical protein